MVYPTSLSLIVIFVFFYATQNVYGDFHVALSEQLKEDNNSTEHCLEKSANKCQWFLDCCASSCYHKYKALTRRLPEQSGLNFYQLKEDDCVQNETRIVNASCICKNGANTFWTINRPVEPKIVAKNVTTKHQKQQQNLTASSCESNEQSDKTRKDEHKQPLKVLIGNVNQLTNACSQNATNSASSTEKPCELFVRCCQSECARAKEDFQAGVFKSDELKGKTTVVSYSIEISHCEDDGNKTAVNKSEKSLTTIGEAQCSCNFTIGESFRLDIGNPLKALFVPSLREQNYTVVEGGEGKNSTTTNSSTKDDPKNDTSSPSSSTTTTDSPPLPSTTTTDKNSSHNNSIIPGGPIANPHQQSQGQKPENTKNAASASLNYSCARTLLLFSVLAVPLLIAAVSSFV